MLINESEYWNFKALNYSSIKTFETNQMKFYKEFILGQRKPPDNSYSLVMGGLIDVLLLNDDKFDEKYKVASCPKPTGQFGEFIDELYLVTLQYLDENNIVTESLKHRIELAFSNFKLKYPDKFKNKKVDYIIENFNKKDKEGNSPALYFQECLASFGKTVIDNFLLNRAEKIVDYIKFGKYTKSFFQKEENVDTITQQGIVFNYKGELCKSLIDLIKVNHNSKLIKGIDLKSTWNSDNFEYNFKKYGYYIQAPLYHEALNTFREDMGLLDYKIDDSFDFLVVDTSMEYCPHFWSLSLGSLKKCRKGFTDKLGFKYKGLDELIDEIQYCKVTGDYTDTLLLNNNNGIIKLDI